MPPLSSTPLYVALPIHSEIHNATGMIQDKEFSEIRLLLSKTHNGANRLERQGFQL